MSFGKRAVIRATHPALWLTLWLVFLHLFHPGLEFTEFKGKFIYFLSKFAKNLLKLILHYDIYCDLL